MTILHEKPIVFEDNSELHLSHDEDMLIMKIDSQGATVDIYFNKQETDALYSRLFKVIQRWKREDRNF